jgi:BNR repeat-containing family member
MLYLRCLVIFVLLTVVTASAWADLAMTKVGDSTVDPQALTIQGEFGQGINGLAFQQDAVVTHDKHQYVGYYDGDRHVCLARRKLPAGAWQSVRFPDYDFKSNDAHNTISIGICPQDGTIHMAFDHHGHPLHYRVSAREAATNPEGVTWNASLFSPIRSELEAGKPIAITYPRFWQTPDGGLQFCYRRGGSGNGDRMLVDYDPGTGTWAHTRQIDSRKGPFHDAMGPSNSRCSYPNGYGYGPAGSLHATWVWREGSQGSNHNLMYAYSTDGGDTWRNNDGQVLTEPAHVNSPGITVAEISRQHGLMNTHGQAVDSQGRVHVVIWHCTNESLAAAGSKPGEHRWGPPSARRYHHYWRGREGRWHHTELPWPAGNRPKVFIDADDNAYVICGVRSPGATLADGHLHREGDLVIAGATAALNWEDWKILHREKGPFVNEMLGDLYRWKTEAVLSVMVQESPGSVHEATPLRILDYAIKTR